jgi:hypothetical protein
MKDIGYGKGYEWQANFQAKDGFLPPELDSIDFFRQT